MPATGLCRVGLPDSDSQSADAKVAAAAAAPETHAAAERIVVEMPAQGSARFEHPNEH